MNIHSQSTRASASAPSQGRRSFLCKTLVAAAAIGTSGLLMPRRARAVTPALTFEADIPGTGDIKVLNFALADEQLASDLHEQALMRLTTGGKNALGIEIPGLKISTDEIDVQYVSMIHEAEVAHAAFLSDTLGSNAISPFKYDFNMESLHREQVLNLLWHAAMLDTAGYLGAAAYFSTRKYVLAAASINGDEARHAAIFAEILNELYSEGLSVAPLASPFTDSNGGKDTPLTPDQVLEQLSPFIVVDQ